MGIEQVVGQLNWVDWVVVIVVVVGIVGGIHQGLVSGALDLIGLAFSLVAGVFGAPLVAPLITQAADVPPVVATVVGFLILIVVVQIVISVAVGLIFRLSRPLRGLLWQLTIVDHVLGVIPGAIKGGLYAALILVPFAVLPVVPQVSTGIERSTLGSRLAIAVVGRAPQIESTLRTELKDGLPFLTPRQPGEGVQANFGALGRLEPDPAAEEELLGLLNRERVKAGLQPLQLDAKLQEVARTYSLEMFQSGYIAHVSPTSGSPADRLQRAGVRFEVAGENLAHVPTIQAAYEGFMKSPTHRANVLRPEFSRTALGVIKSEFQGLMITHKFAD